MKYLNPPVFMFWTFSRWTTGWWS